MERENVASIRRCVDEDGADLDPAVLLRWTEELLADLERVWSALDEVAADNVRFGNAPDARDYFTGKQAVVEYIKEALTGPSDPLPCPPANEPECPPETQQPRRSDVAEFNARFYGTP